MTLSALPVDYEQTLHAWRQDKEAELRADESWLTLCGLYWLQPGANTLGSAVTADVMLPAGSDHIGTLTLAEDGVRLQVASADPVQVDGALARDALLRADTHPEGPARVTLANATFIIIQRGMQYAVRVWDRQHPARETFSGRQWFPPSAAHYVTAQYVPHAAPRTFEVPSQIGIPVPFSNPGYVTFELAGVTCRLEAFDVGPERLWFLFKDATSGDSTYGPGRFLLGTLADDQRALLDFNQAHNPPCAFTPYATCPLPPPENTLPVPVLAGERRPQND